jgi:hypothetical protein
MRIGVSLVLIALGAILRWGVTTNSSHGFNIATIGVILMIVGAAGLIISLVWMGTRRRTDVIERTDASPQAVQSDPRGPHYSTTRTTTYVEDHDPTDRPY